MQLITQYASSEAGTQGTDCSWLALRGISPASKRSQSIDAETAKGPTGQVSGDLVRAAAAKGITLAGVAGRDACESISRAHAFRRETR